MNDKKRVDLNPYKGAKFQILVDYYLKHHRSDVVLQKLRLCCWEGNPVNAIDKVILCAFKNHVKELDFDMSSANYIYSFPVEHISSEYITSLTLRGDFNFKSTELSICCPSLENFTLLYKVWMNTIKLSSSKHKSIDIHGEGLERFEFESENLEILRVRDLSNYMDVSTYTKLRELSLHSVIITDIPTWDSVEVIELLDCKTSRKMNICNRCLKMLRLESLEHMDNISVGAKNLQNLKLPFRIKGQAQWTLKLAKILENYV